MSVELEESPATTDDDHNDGLNHYYCCDPDKALCGRDISHHPEIDHNIDNNNDCIVCTDLITSVCPICGND